MYLSDGINVPATECEAVCFMTKDNSIIARQKKNILFWDDQTKCISCKHVFLVASCIPTCVTWIKSVDSDVM